MVAWGMLGETLNLHVGTDFANDPHPKRRIWRLFGRVLQRRQMAVRLSTFEIERLKFVTCDGHRATLQPFLQDV